MKITAAIFALLPATLQPSFKLNPTNPDEYDNGEEVADNLKGIIQKEKDEKAALASRVATFEADKAKAVEDARTEALKTARSSGDFKAIEKDYQDQIAALKTANDEAKKAREGDLINAAVDKEAAELAKAFVSPRLAMAEIKGRLKGELVDGVAIVRVLDKAGKASATSIQELRNEFLTDPELKGSIIASQGGGGGSTQVPGGGGSTPTSKKSFKTATDESQFAIANPEAYAALPEG